MFVTYSTRLLPDCLYFYLPPPPAPVVSNSPPHSLPSPRPLLPQSHSTYAALPNTQNDNKINRTKDRQENAIYAFTIVTVIFLPLSAVASVFGMNSADIRDMDAGQWVYWATALPVTAVVMLLGLVYTGEMRRLRAWVAERVAERVARWITSNTKGEWEPVNDRDREREKERERDWREVGRR